jgi:hypothetical protein
MKVWVFIRLEISEASQRPSASQEGLHCTQPILRGTDKLRNAMSPPPRFILLLSEKEMNCLRIWQSLSEVQGTPCRGAPEDAVSLFPATPARAATRKRGWMASRGPLPRLIPATCLPACSAECRHAPLHENERLTQWRRLTVQLQFALPCGGLKAKGQGYPRPLGLWDFKIPHCIDNLLSDGG